MSQLNSRILDHAIWAEFEKIKLDIKRALARESIDLETAATIERIHAVILLTESRLTATDTQFVTLQTLTTISNLIVGAREQLDAYCGDGNTDRIVTANSRADEIISFIGFIPVQIDAAEITAMQVATSSYRTTIESFINAASAKQRELAASYEDTVTKLANMQNILDAEQKKLSMLVIEHQSQFSAAQDLRASEFSALQSEQQAKIIGEMAEQKAQFSADQDTRKTAFADTVRKNQEEISSLTSSYEQRFKDQEVVLSERVKEIAQSHHEDLEALKSEYENDAANTLIAVKKHQSDVEKLVGVIGNLGVTSGYLKQANHARIMLYVWQTLTVVALAGLIWVAYLVAFGHEKTSISMQEVQDAKETLNNVQATQPPKEAGKRDSLGAAIEGKQNSIASASHSVTQPVSESVFYQGFLTRLFLSLTFGIFAAYSARQATHFFEIEQKNRKRALELEAFGPFIESLDKEAQDKFRLQIGDRSFAVPDSPTKSTADGEPVSASAVLQELKEFISNFMKGKT